MWYSYIICICLFAPSHAEDNLIDLFLFVKRTPRKKSLKERKTAELKEIQRFFEDIRLFQVQGESERGKRFTFV